MSDLTNEELMEAEHRERIPLGDELDILREQFKVACERAEAWKKLALDTRQEFGVIAELLGRASAVLYQLGVNHDAGLGTPPEMARMAKELEALIQRTIINVPIPEVLKGEVG